MMFSVGIRTVPARVALFSRLLDRLNQESVPVHVSGDDRIAPNENGCRALELAVADHPDWVMFLEDDVGLIHDFFGSAERWLRDHERADVHCYPFGCQYPVWEIKGMAAWAYHIDKFYCSVAVAVRATQVASLVAYLRASPHVRQGFDTMMGNWHRTVSSARYLVTPNPCFVDHLGDESTLVDGRQNRNVVGHFKGFRGYDVIYRGRHG